MYWNDHQPLLLRDQALRHQDIVQTQAYRGWATGNQQPIPAIPPWFHMISIRFYWCFFDIFWPCWSRWKWCASNPVILSNSVHFSKAANSIWLGLMFRTQVFFEQGVSVHPKHPWTSYWKWPFIVSFPHYKWWCSIVMLNYQRAIDIFAPPLFTFRFPARTLQ